MHVYDYKITVSPRETHASKNIRTLGYVCFIYGAASKVAAVDEFMAKDMKVARKNGVQRGKNQFKDNLTITRIKSRKVA